MEKLSLVLPETPPYIPRQFGRCAVIGNSGYLLKTRFGKEMDAYGAVVRENGAQIKNHTECVGSKSTFRLLNRGSAKDLDKVAELDEIRKEALIIKTTVHDIMNHMIRIAISDGNAVLTQEVPISNPVNLMLDASFGSAAKGTGLKALEFVLSICDSVECMDSRLVQVIKNGLTTSRSPGRVVLCFTVELTTKRWSAWEMHSPMRPDPNSVVKWVSSRDVIKCGYLCV